jgi:hypothetical protein
VRISKIVHADTTIKAHRFTTTSNGDIDNIQDISVPVKTGNTILVDIRGLHMNRAFLLLLYAASVTHLSTAMYWGSDAASFKPERFMDTESYKWPRDACTFPTVSISSTIPYRDLHSRRVFCRPAKLHRAAVRANGERVRACQFGADLRNFRSGEAAREAF